MVRVVAFDIGVCNFAWCVADVNEGSNPVIIQLNNCRIGNAKDPIAVLMHSMAAVLHQHKSTVQDGIQNVRIEQQVTLRASKNQSLSAALYMFYASLQAAGHVSLQSVEFVHPRAKFKKALALPYAVLDPFRTDLKQARGPALKKISVNVTKVLLQHWHCDEAYAQICAAKKQDDLADSCSYACLCWNS